MSTKQSIQEQVKASGLSRKQWYSQVYLRSDHWNDVRTKALMSSKFACRGCCCKDKLQVHHLTYANLGAECLDDLMVLCDECHALTHALLNEMNGVLDAPVQRRVLSHFLFYALVSKDKRKGMNKCKKNHKYNTLPKAAKDMVAKAKKSLKKKQSAT